MGLNVLTTTDNNLGKNIVLCQLYDWKLIHMFCLFRWFLALDMKVASHSKQKQVAKTWSVEELVVENVAFQVDACGKQEIHSVPWGYMFNLWSKVDTMLDNQWEFVKKQAKIADGCRCIKLGWVSGN